MRLAAKVLVVAPAHRGLQALEWRSLVGEFLRVVGSDLGALELVLDRRVDQEDLGGVVGTRQGPG